ncbi:MAG: molybdopterin-binding protein [Phascolarctobacterium faecium]
MIVEVVNTGTELLLGEILNTNFQYLSRQLNKLGYDVLYQTTVGDNETRLRSVLEIALERADIVTLQVSWLQEAISLKKLLLICWDWKCIWI